MVFTDLRKAYVTVLRDLIWYCVRKRGREEFHRSFYASAKAC